MAISVTLVLFFFFIVSHKKQYFNLYFSCFESDLNKE